MNQENNKQKEKLILLLQERLDRHFSAAEEEFNCQEIIDTLTLLDVLNPLPESESIVPEESWKRFLEKYPHVKKKDVRKARYAKAGKILIVCAAVVFLFILGLNMGTYPAKHMSFFEYIKFENDKQHFYVTGQEPEMILSWEELPENLLTSVHIPAMPSGMRLQNITYQANQHSFSLTASYENSNGNTLSLFIYNREVKKIAFVDTAQIEGTTVYMIGHTYSFHHDGKYYSIRSTLGQAETTPIISSILIGEPAK